MNFQNFIDFLKVADLIPIHLHRPAGKMKVQPFGSIVASFLCPELTRERPAGGFEQC